MTTATTTTPAGVTRSAYVDRHDPAALAAVEAEITKLRAQVRDAERLATLPDSPAATVAARVKAQAERQGAAALLPELQGALAEAEARALPLRVAGAYAAAYERLGGLHAEQAAARAALIAELRAALGPALDRWSAQVAGWRDAGAEVTALRDGLPFADMTDYLDWQELQRAAAGGIPRLEHLVAEALAEGPGR